MPKGAAFRRAADHGITPENRTTMWNMCHADEAFQKAVEDLQRMDGLLESDNVQQDQRAGFSMRLMGVQDGGSALLTDQLIPANVNDVGDHIDAARRLHHPASSVFQGSEYLAGHDYEVRRDAEINSAVRRNVERGDSGPQVVLADVAEVERIERSLRPLARRLREALSPPHIRCTPFGHANAAFSAAGIAALNDEDADLPLRQLMGAPVAGDLPPTNSWDRQTRSRTTAVDFDDLPHAQWNAYLHRSVAQQAATPQGRVMAEAVWAKSISELDKGLCDGPFEFEDVNAMYGPEGFRAARRFGVIQNGEIRVCDNEKENLENAASTERDKLRTQSPDWSSRAAARFAWHIGEAVRGWSLEHGTDDIDAAYRRVLNATPGFTVVAAFNPTAGRTQYFVLPGFNFGLVSAVIYFNAVPAFGAKFARRILAIVCDHYFDDFDTLALRGQGAAYQEALGRLMAALGYPFSAKKHVETAETNPFLGVQSDFSRVAAEGIVVISVSEKRRKKIRDMCDAAMTSLSPSEAEVLAGKVGWTLQWAFGKVGRAALQPIHVRASSKVETRVTPALRRALEFIRDVVVFLPPREIRLGRPDRPPVLIWSDAMYEPGRRGKPEQAAGGFVAIFPEEPGSPEEVIFSSDVTSGRVMDKFFRRKQYIGQLEILYGVTPYWTLGSRLAGRQVIHFIDNTSACAALVKGYAACLDSGLLVNAFHAFNVGLRADVFFEYVRSKANIADLPSRLAMDELWEMFRDLGMEDKARSIEMVIPTFEDWHAPARDLVSRGASIAVATEPATALLDGRRGLQSKRAGPSASSSRSSSRSKAQRRVVGEGSRR